MVQETVKETVQETNHMADTITPNPADVGMASGPAPIPADPSTIQPNPAAQPPTAPQPEQKSNVPDADTAAAKSMPAQLVNNPQVPSQQLADKVDDNKKSSSPAHSQLYRAAIEMVGGPRTTTTYDADGKAQRTPVPVKPWQLGMALALHVLSGGMAGANAENGPAAFKTGQEEAQKKQAEVKQANQQQDTQAKADQDHKLAVMKNNLEIHQLAVNIGTKDKDANQAHVDQMKPQVEMLEANPSLIKGDENEDQMNALLKSGKANVTRDSFIPHGDPYEIMDPTTGKQKEVNGVPIWGHHYYYVDPNGQAELTQKIQDQGYKMGKFRNPDGSQVKIPAGTQYPVLTMLKQGTENAQIKAAEDSLEDQKNDILGDKKGPRVSLADEYASDPQSWGPAIDDYSRFLGAGSAPAVFGAMMKAGKGQSAALLMKFMGVTPDDITAHENKLLQEHTEATTKEPQEKALTPEEKEHMAAENKHLAAETTASLSVAAKNDAERNQLKVTDANRASTVDAFGRGQVAPQNIAFLLRGKEGQALLNEVTAKYPDIDSTKLQNYSEKSSEFTGTKKGTSGSAINNGATAFKHLLDLEKLNKNWSHVPGTPSYTAYKNQADTLVDELGQFYGNTTIPGLADFKDTLLSTLPGNREAAIRTQAHSMGEKMDSYVQQWNNIAPSKSYQRPMPFYDNAARSARQHLTGSTGTEPNSGVEGANNNANAKTVKFQGQQIPINTDGTINYNGGIYKLNPDGKGATLVPKQTTQQ
jgi:hypothetical protein